MNAQAIEVKMMKPLSEQRLHNTLPQTGRVEWIGRAAARRAPIEAVSQVQINEGTGIEGDHHAKGQKAHTKRQVTLIQSEHLPVIAALSGHAEVPPEWLRRNIVVSGIPLLALLNKRFTIGEAILETTGLCDPCQLMEKKLGPGGFNAMQGHGGITARVVSSGRVQVGDALQWTPKD